MRTITIEDPQWIESLDAPEGFTADLMADWDAPNPREQYDHFAVLVQHNSRCIDVDEPDSDILRAWEHCRYTLGRKGERVLDRWLRLFRPDVLHFEHYWSAGDSYGFGYVTREGWESAMGADYNGDYTPADLLKSEVSEYDLWCTGSCYGVIVTNDETGEEASLWGIYDPDGIYITTSVIPDLVREVSTDE